MDNVTIYYSKSSEEYVFVFNDTKRKLHDAYHYDCLIAQFSKRQEMVFAERGVCMKGSHLGRKIDISEAPDEIIQFWNNYKNGEDMI